MGWDLAGRSDAKDGCRKNFEKVVVGRDLDVY